MLNPRLSVLAASALIAVGATSVALTPQPTTAIDATLMSARVAHVPTATPSLLASGLPSPTVSAAASPASIAPTATPATTAARPAAPSVPTRTPIAAAPATTATARPATATPTRSATPTPTAKPTPTAEPTRTAPTKRPVARHAATASPSPTATRLTRTARPTPTKSTATKTAAPKTTSSPSPRPTATRTSEQHDASSRLDLRRASLWDRIATCESSGDWSINSGNGFYGGLQFSASTWRMYGGTDFASRPDHATRGEQITVANKVYDTQGGASPDWACARILGID